MLSPADPESPRLRWRDAWVVRAVRAIEEAHGALDDAQAVRQAALATTRRDERIVVRAQALGERLGLPDEIARWRARLPWLMLAAALFVALVSAGIVGAVTGGDRRINALAALLALLGMPSASLLFWCASLAWRRPPAGGGLPGWTVALAARLPGLRTPQALRLVDAGLETLTRARLAPWALGLANHALWVGAFALILTGLLWAFAFRAYTLTWETTILDPGVFSAVVTTTGWLPARLGLPVPDAAAALAAQVPAPDQRPWAWWLVGCTLVYGLLPRLLALAACALVWRLRRSRLAGIDTADPYFRRLAARFDRWDAAVIVDAELPAPSKGAQPERGAWATDTLAVVGFELPDDLPWPPDGLADLPGWIATLAGTADERRATLDRIARTRPRRLVLVCHAPATPDRGTERFLRDALAWGAEGALLLLGPPSGQPRWSDWLQRGGLGQLPVFTDARDAATWSAGGGRG